MGAPANFVWLPLWLMLMAMAWAPLAFAQNNDTTSSSPSTLSSSGSRISTTIPPRANTDLVIGGDLNKAARVEEMTKDMTTEFDTTMTSPKGIDDGGYDIIDVMAATGANVGKPKSGQTTRIYTTGEVNDDFWLKHLGEDFKHAIHLQVGGTNDDYNSIINQTTNGIHEEVHHEYLPGAERPPELQQHQQHQQQQQQQQQLQAANYNQPNLVTQMDLDGEAMALKNSYLRRQADRQQLYSRGYASPSQQYNNRHAFTQQHTYPRTHTTHHTEHTQHTHTHTHTHTQSVKPRNTLHSARYPSNQSHNRSAGNLAPSPSESTAPSYINSSEDTLHTSQSQASPRATISAGSSDARDAEDLESQLPFKSPFNDYGSRPTRDLTYLLYKRGL